MHVARKTHTHTHTHELLSHLILEFNRYNCAENLKITAFKLNNY